MFLWIQLLEKNNANEWFIRLDLMDITSLDSKIDFVSRKYVIKWLKFPQKVDQSTHKYLKPQIVISII